MALLWRSSRKKFGLEDIDIYLPFFCAAIAAAASPGGTAPSCSWIKGAVRNKED